MVLLLAPGWPSLEHDPPARSVRPHPCRVIPLAQGDPSAKVLRLTTGRPTASRTTSPRAAGNSIGDVAMLELTPRRQTNVAATPAPRRRRARVRLHDRSRGLAHTNRVRHTGNRQHQARLDHRLLIRINGSDRADQLADAPGPGTGRWRRSTGGSRPLSCRGDHHHAHGSTMVADQNALPEALGGATSPCHRERRCHRGRCVDHLVPRQAVPVLRMAPRTRRSTAGR